MNTLKATRDDEGYYIMVPLIFIFRTTTNVSKLQEIVYELPR